MTRLVRWASIASFAALSALGGTPSAHGKVAQKTRVLVVGIDAGEWDVLGPLMDRGQCPNFTRLRAAGSAGKLRSLIPMTVSPIIWSSIATGKVPQKHGVQDFFSRKVGPEIDDVAPVAGRRPVTSNLQKSRSIWTILGALDHTVGVVGWWTTWPAQPVNGVLVSDYVQYKADWPGRNTRLTYPDSIWPMVRQLRRTPESVSWSEILQFVAPFDTTQVTGRQQQILRMLKTTYASDMTFYRVAMALYKEKRPDFFTVYFRGVDEVSHSYWDLDVPSPLFDPPLTKAEIAWLHPLISNYYIFTDRLLGEFLRLAGEDTDVIVCSDHGFGGGGLGVMAHKPDGIIFMAGPHMVRGGTITGATVLDITPTILATFGLPTARDMDGRPIQGGLQPQIVKRIERDTRLPTYETAGAKGKSEEPLRSPVDDELRERLRSLGYIQ